MHRVNNNTNEPARHETEDLLALAEEAGDLGIFEWQVREGTVRVSSKFVSIYGLTNFDGRYDTWLKSIHREDLVRVLDLTESTFASRARKLHVEFRIVRASDGALRWIDARRIISYDEKGPVRVVGVSRDVTEHKQALVQVRNFTETLDAAVRSRTRELDAENEARKKAEAQVRQMQKMEAVGQLTGGIAHDFNNTLAVIISGNELVKRRIGRGEDARKLIEGISEAAHRAAALTHRLLAFSRQLPLAPETVDANRLIGGMSDMLRRSLGETTQLEVVLAGGLWKTHADIAQLESSILNLAINARDAMSDGGRLTIETQNTHLDDEYARANVDLSAGQYVLIALTDTGTGMPPDVVEKALDPFFTTKPVGKGTGLGLSQVYGFVKQSKGHLKLYSELGKGTTVKIYLPRLYGAVDEVPAPDRQALPLGTREEIILVVEDDARIREVAVEALRELGYSVVHASSAAAALKILRNRDDIGLMFTDIVMPEMNGRMLAEEAQKLHSKLRVLFTTGYTRNAVVHNGVLDPGVNFLAKPYTLDQLARKVREVLSNRDDVARGTWRT